MDSLSNLRVLRHVYVAEVTDAVQFAGGQNDVARLSDPACPITALTAGNVVGLLGPSLIVSLPKSGLLVSSLRLVVASPGRYQCVLPLAGLSLWHGAPVVSLALEPASATDPNDLTRLEIGLRLLERSDPCAEVHLFNDSLKIHNTEHLYFMKLQNSAVTFLQIFSQVMERFTRW